MILLKSRSYLLGLSLQKWVMKHLKFIGEKLKLDFPTEKDKFNFKNLDYILLGVVFASVSGWQAVITGREDLSEFIVMFSAMFFFFYGFTGVWSSLNPEKVKQQKLNHTPKLQAYLIRKGILKRK